MDPTETMPSGLECYYRGMTRNQTRAGMRFLSKRWVWSSIERYETTDLSFGEYIRLFTRDILEEHDRRRIAKIYGVSTTSEECVVCMDRSITHVLIPCGHKGFCAVCARGLHERGETCAICRSRIEGIMHDRMGSVDNLYSV